jgi:hypothetical protein
LERVATLFDSHEISCDQSQCAPKKDEKSIGDGYKSKFEPKTPSLGSYVEGTEISSCYSGDERNNKHLRFKSPD